MSEPNGYFPDLQRTGEIYLPRSSRELNLQIRPGPKHDEPYEQHDDDHVQIQGLEFPAENGLLQSKEQIHLLLGIPTVVLDLHG